MQLSCILVCVGIQTVNFKLVMFAQYVRHGDCFLLVYAINSCQSVEEVQAMHQWINRMRDQDMPMVRTTTLTS